VFAQQKTIWAYLAFSILLVLSVVAGCGPTPQPTPTATPTSAPISLVLDVNPNVKEIEAGTTVAIVARVSTGEEASLTWSVEGTSRGELSSETGDAVFYTAGDPGADIVTAEGTTADGAPVKERVSFNVVAAEATAPVLPTDMPVPSADVTPATPSEPPSATPECESFRPPIDGPSVGGEVEITSLENCTTGLPSATGIPLVGTYRDIPEDLELWILVYPPNFCYYPQSPNACQELPVQRSGGRWNVVISLGREGYAEQFDIVAVLADSQASRAFKDYLRTGCDTEIWECFSTLPEGQITEMDAITVFTKG